MQFKSDVVYSLLFVIGYIYFVLSITPGTSNIYTTKQRKKGRKKKEKMLSLFLYFIRFWIVLLAANFVNEFVLKSGISYVVFGLVVLLIKWIKEERGVLKVFLQ